MRHASLLRGAKLERMNLLEKSRMEKFIRDNCPDVIVHLAAVPLVSAASKNPEEAKHSMSLGLLNLLEIVRGQPEIKRFVYVSSSMAYGNFIQDPMPEDGPTEPLSVYGGLKLSGEILTRSYLETTPTDHVVVRPSSVYGPTDQHGRVVQLFCENALLGRPLAVFEGNDTVMDFTHVEDAAGGLALAAIHPNAANQTFNISFGRGRSLTELAEIVQRQVPRTKIEYRSSTDPDRPRRGALSTEKARRLIGYVPRWPLEDGVAAYLDHLVSQRCNQTQAAC